MTTKACLELIGGPCDGWPHCRPAGSVIVLSTVVKRWAVYVVGKDGRGVFVGTTETQRQGLKMGREWKKTRLFE